MGNIKKILKNVYGYDDFKKGQEVIINSILSGRDTIGILTTGGGKSICYQIPALLLNGITLVVSPLISLMKDQVDALKMVGVDAIYFNSTLTNEEYKNNINAIKFGKVKIIYIAPERLENKKFVNFISRFKISMLVVDEAHCISMWGHDFRKMYLEIPKFIRNLNQKVRILALTATATKKVREDIITKLEMDNPYLFVGGFDRENIFFDVTQIEEEDYFEAQKIIKEYIKSHKNQAGIIYASTRKEVDGLYEYLKICKFSVGKYHAGMDEKEREINQDKFSKDEFQVMVATNAFGMGIDKSNIRYIIHRNIPRDLESYYQEAGRAGRDGGDAYALLIYDPKDISVQKFFIDDNLETTEELKEEKHRKLKMMVEYATSETCYRERLLKYFGDKMIRDYCGNCGNCKDVEDIEDFTIEAQKVLSCIGRAKQMVGVSTLVSILLGRYDSKIKRKGYENLSTFGIMRDRKNDWLEEFINFLLIEGYMSQSAGSFPVLQLNSKSYDVLENRIKVSRKNGEIMTYNHYDNEVFKNLYHLRGEIAREENVAPYIVFSDVTLVEMAELKPKTRWEMLKIHGVGNQKYKNYGERFLEILNGEKKKDFGIFSDIEKVKEVKEILNLDIESKKLQKILSEVFEK